MQVTAVQSKTAEQDKQTQDKNRVRAFLDLALNRFKLSADAESEWRKDALEDFEFRMGKQWADDMEQKRKKANRPCLTMNRMPQFIRQVTNEQRQQRPSVQVNPVGDNADTDVAEVLQGTIRHIEVNSDAEVAYDTAFDHMATGGVGYWRLITDYIDDNSFDQEIFVKPIENPFAVYRDPFMSLLDPSTANWYFIVSDPSPQEYKAQYPKSTMAGLNDYSSLGDNAAGWATKETIRVAEYFYVEYETKTLALKADGSIVDASALAEGEAAVKTRNVLKRKVKWAKINAVEILEEREWAGKWIPIIPVFGDTLKIDGKVYLAGVVRNAKDPQRLYNFHCSAAAEAIALAPKAPWTVVEGQIEGYEKFWETSNIDNWAVLTYKNIDVGGKPAPAPSRNAVEPPIQAMMLMVRQADNDLKATTGIYDASLGEKGPDQSGKAILARQKQGDVATLNFSDNMARSYRYEGRMFLDLIPKIYDTDRIQRIFNPDGTTKMVQLKNSQNSQGQQPAEQQPTVQ